MHASTRLAAFAALDLLLAAATAGPALAHSGAEDRRVALSDGSTITYKADTGQYCWTHEVTGSNLPRRECHTQQEWAKLGLNISGK